MKFIALLLGAALTLSGCVKLLPDPPQAPHIYPLDAGEVTRAPGPPAPVVIAVAEPQTQDFYGTDRIVWRRDGALAYLDGAAWPGNIPEVMQGLVAETIARRGAVQAGVRTGAGIREDLDIRWDLLNFNVDEGADGLSALAKAQVSIVRARTRDLIATDLIEVREPLSSRSGGAAAEALARAARTMAGRIADMAATAATIPAPLPPARAP